MKLPQNLTFQDLFDSQGLSILDQDFTRALKQHNEALYSELLRYRDKHLWQKSEISTFVLALAPFLENYLITIFDVRSEYHALQNKHINDHAIFRFKNEWVIPVLKNATPDTSVQSTAFIALLHQNKHYDPQDLELSVAKAACDWIDEDNQEALSLLTAWCLEAMHDPETQDWVSFRLPKRIDLQNLIQLKQTKHPEKKLLNTEKFFQRDNFDLTDKRMSDREYDSEVHYCVYCHEKDTDFCSTGFPINKKNREEGFRENALGITLTGCPLDEKISEMHTLKKEESIIGALATIMVDNPLCPMTGHRICNDCMKSCIFQKFEPVNIPQIETGVLTDVLSLKYGVEIYDLLTRWNPLRQNQWIQKPYSGKKVLIAGMGPAGMTMAHHLLQEGCAVVGIEGLKIEPLPEAYLTAPIEDYTHIQESLSERIMAGFGGVAEYGITVRWDKNFLKLLYISLMRRKHFSVYGNTRFGGTITIEKAQALGFHHLVIAVGAGFPKAMPIPGSLAPGMRQANDFLMALQLTGAAKQDSMTNLQIRLPAIVVGGGLTGVDAATELQAYYLQQIQKIKKRFDILVDKYSEEKLLKHFDVPSKEILEEYLSHARALEKEYEDAKAENREADTLSLIHQWGGVTIAYRRSIKESPAYLNNYEELQKALEQGIYYAENLQPIEAKCDTYGHVEAMVFDKKDGGSATLPAKSILIATGAQLNIAYTFEHHGILKRNGLQYERYSLHNGELVPTTHLSHCKDPNFGPLTSYNENNFKVSFIGDTHPVFHGNVVRAIASGLRTYPKVMEAMEHVKVSKENYESFHQDIRFALETKVIGIKRRNRRLLEITLQAPLAAERYQPGQFFRLQSYETHSPKIKETRLQTEAIALTASKVDPEKGQITLMSYEFGASSRLLALLTPESPVSLMGPTGVRSKVPETQETVLIIGQELSMAHIQTYGKALREQGNKVIYVVQLPNTNEVVDQQAIEHSCDNILWCIPKGKLKTRKQDRLSPLSPMETLLEYAQEANKHDDLLPLSNVNRVQIIGNTSLLKSYKHHYAELKPHFNEEPKTYGSVYSTMQCMLKGVCAQCLQWQVDPETGKRKKAVFACSWQDQPLELVDLQNLDERLSQNRMQETLSNLWVDYLFETEEIERC